MKKLKGANMDIDLFPNENVEWEIEKCPWNEADGENKHKCAVKNISICKFFHGIEKPDIVLCSYPEEKE